MKVSAAYCVIGMLLIGLAADAVATPERPIRYFMVHGQAFIDVTLPASQSKPGRAVGGAAFDTFDSQQWPTQECSTRIAHCVDLEVFAVSIPVSASTKQWVAGNWRFRAKGCLDAPGSTCKRRLFEFENTANDRKGSFVYSSSRGVEVIETHGAANESDCFVLLSDAAGIVLGSE